MPAPSILTKYLDPNVLNAVVHQPIEARHLVEGNLAGAHRSPRSGFAVEFTGHREYVPGDDPRHIDWRVYYARDKYFVKQYELETNFVCHLLLDISASMNYGHQASHKLTYAKNLLAVLAYCVVQQNDKVGLITFDEIVRTTVRAGNTLDQVLRVLQVLDGARAEEKTDFVRSLEAATDQMGRREIAIVCSDFLTSDLKRLESTLQHLRYQGHEVVLLQIAHHDELSFDMQGMLRFEGLEDDEAILAEAGDIRDDYLRIVREFILNLHDLALRNQCEHMLVDTSRPLRDVLIDYLNHRRQTLGDG